MQRLVIASANPGKVRELDALLAPLAFQVIAQSSLGIDAAEELHATFVENALAKARHAARRSGLPALADDSGLCCAALRGEPGVRSARFALDVGARTGQPATEQPSDAANNNALLQRLHGLDDRRAHYVCVLVALRASDDPEPLIAAARWYGEVLTAPRGSGGFGYDPLFWIPELRCTAAELPAAEKNRISHRGRALEQLAEKLKSEWQS